MMVTVARAAQHPQPPSQRAYRIFDVSRLSTSTLIIAEQAKCSSASYHSACYDRAALYAAGCAVEKEVFFAIVRRLGGATYRK
jgi:hypothetical protein